MQTTDYIHLESILWSISVLDYHRPWTEVPCLVWDRSVNHKGYGRLWTPRTLGSIKTTGSTKSVHRATWEMVFGEIPSGLEVLHKCDNPPCFHPSHLFTGNQSDNIMDCISKGRHISSNSGLKGSRHPSSKLTEDIVLEIRSRRKDGIPQVEIARSFGLSQATVSMLVNKKRWTHI
jgi:hypothetical protein